MTKIIFFAFLMILQIKISLCLPMAMAGESGLTQAMNKAEAMALTVAENSKSSANPLLRKSSSLSNLDSLAGGRVSSPELQRAAAAHPIANELDDESVLRASTSAPPHHDGGFISWWKKYLENAKKESIEAGVWDTNIKTLRGHI